MIGRVSREVSSANLLRTDQQSEDADHEIDLCTTIRNSSIQPIRDGRRMSLPNKPIRAMHRGAQNRERGVARRQRSRKPMIEQRAISHERQRQASNQRPLRTANARQRKPVSSHAMMHENG